MAELITTDYTPPAPGGAYSRAFRTGVTLWFAGHVGVDPSTGDVAHGVGGQTRQALRNLEAVLNAAGGSLASLVTTTCFLTTWRCSWPSRSSVGVQPAGGYVVEIEGSQ